MGCCGRREKLADVRAEQKWDYINLSDFKSTTCFTPLSYGILYISLIISVAVYGVDIFTAANLLFFDRWSGQVKPVIPFHISRWIFAACILLSWILLVYRWVRAVRAVRAMRTGIVAASYLDPLAFMIQSVRMGANGRGWRRFLVFAELTKGRKGAEYVALFTYFSFEAWLRIVFAEGPRQVINALTLYSVMQANLVPVGEHAPKKGGSPVAQFFINLRILANHNREQAAILFGMLFTLVIWAIAALSLFVAALCYILFLWHYIPTADDGLSGYCRRKVDSRLHKIVGVKVKKALAIGYSPRIGSDPKTAKNGKSPARVIRQPTLPLVDFEAEDKHTEVPISRRTTESTLPLYIANANVENSGRPKRGNKAELIIPYMPPFQPRPVPSSRTNTNSSAHSNTSYFSNAPLLQAAEEMGYGPSPDDHSAAAPFGLSSGRRQPPSIERNITNKSNNTQRLYDTAYRSQHSQGRKTPGLIPAGHPGFPNQQQSECGFSSAQSDSSMDNDYLSAVPAASPLDHTSSRVARLPVNQQTDVQEYEMRSPRPTHEGEQYHSKGPYIAFNSRVRTQPQPSPAGFLPKKPAMGPTRNFTMPFNRAPPGSHTAQQPSLPQRSGTAPIPFRSSNTQTPRNPNPNPNPNPTPNPPSEASSRMALPPRATTAGPGSPTRHETRPPPRRFY